MTFTGRDDTINIYMMQYILYNYISYTNAFMIISTWIFLNAGTALQVDTDSTG